MGKLYKKQKKKSIEKIKKNIVLRKPKLWITLWFRKEMIYLWITGVKIVLKKNNYIFLEFLINFVLDL